jgi:DNA phosphorothioation-associated DGQHR protein 1
MAFRIIPALKVTQPLGVFFLAKFKVSDLLKISFVEALQYRDKAGHLKGTQRKKNELRLKEIARYVDSEEMAFPNTIILAANYTENGETFTGEEGEDGDGEENFDSDTKTEKIVSPLAWTVEQVSGDLYNIIIPSEFPLAAIIDGQHRINAFEYIDKKERLELEVPCSVYFGISNPYQAYLFATINGNQKRVDRSLALEQFGFNVEDEAKKSWTPEKLAVYFSRRLNIERSSPLHKHIKVAPANEQVLFDTPRNDEWTVSTATIVDGILSLISGKPKRDRVEMAQTRLFGRSREMLKEFDDPSAPLRNLYIEYKDEQIYTLLISYFSIVKDVLWSHAKPNSYIIKTVGLLALFDFLKRVVEIKGVNADFKTYLNQLSQADFTDLFFQASGVGRSRIRMVFYIATGFRRKTDKISADFEAKILQIIKLAPLESQLPVK